MSIPSTPGSWAGPSGLRVEALAPGGERPPGRAAAAVVVEPAAAGEPMWLTAGQWADLCAACAALGAGYAAPAGGAPGAVPA